MTSVIFNNVHKNKVDLFLLNLILADLSCVVCSMYFNSSSILVLCVVCQRCVKGVSSRHKTCYMYKTWTHKFITTSGYFNPNDNYTTIIGNI